ncbi:MAG: arsenate reductase ArsC [Candidatus Omnitrophota bacterium]
MKKQRALFVCVHNSARSQMAEAFLRKYGKDQAEAESAGLEPGKLNPLAVKVMKEKGIDISQNKTKSVFDLYKQNKLYSYVITVCDESQSERCPIFPGLTNRLHWNFEDPANFQGSWEEKLGKTRKIRDQIELKIQQWLKTIE